MTGGPGSGTKTSIWSIIFGKAQSGALHAIFICEICLSETQLNKNRSISNAIRLYDTEHAESF